MMSKIFKCLIVLCLTRVYATGIDETLLLAAKTQGSNVYYACIVTPPVTPQQQAYCSGLYVTYMVNITALNAPYPLVVSLDPDPYAWSPYDICKYEVGHMIFGDEFITPYCPSI
ncbi:MAG: hypothetical protein QG673_1880 [Pseudomonadota bacterium]|nr:hypothetical protein [Pseudomonadota bacterium]